MYNSFFYQKNSIELALNNSKSPEACLPPGFGSVGRFVPFAIELFYEDFGYLTVDVDDVEA